MNTKIKLDFSKIAKALGAKHVGSVEEIGGIAGIIDRLHPSGSSYKSKSSCEGVPDGTHCGSCQDEQPCLVDAHFRHEAEKPVHLRTNHFMIACPCRKCNPITM